jgi:hypothetical protein
VTASCLSVIEGCNLSKLLRCDGQAIVSHGLWCNVDSTVVNSSVFHGRGSTPRY